MIFLSTGFSEVANLLCLLTGYNKHSNVNDEI